ncbi:MAG: hypothetical protein AVDCRST_MAG56-4498, partial [uncultured Cytophagales bacterium]
KGIIALPQSYLFTQIHKKDSHHANILMH